jgi:hypothetical protein
MMKEGGNQRYLPPTKSIEMIIISKEKPLLHLALKSIMEEGTK